MYEREIGRLQSDLADIVKQQLGPALGDRCVTRWPASRGGISYRAELGFSGRNCRLTSMTARLGRGFFFAQRAALVFLMSITTRLPWQFRGIRPVMKHASDNRVTTSAVHGTFQRVRAVPTEPT